MIRLTAILALAAVLSALGVVASQHRSRQLVTTIEREQVHTRNLDVEWNQLDIEQQAVAALPTVERFARTTLNMSPPSKNNQMSLSSGKGG